MINLPNGWQDVYVDQYVELLKLNDKNLPYVEGNIEILSILTDTLPDDDIWEDMDVDELDEYIKKTRWINTEPSKQYSKVINNLTIIDINKISFGEFIDLEHLFIKYYENLTKICAILYKKTKNDEWGNLVYEPYGKYDIDDRSKLFEEVSINSIYGVIEYYLQFKEELHKIYSLLFEPEIEGEDEDIDVYDPEEQKVIQEEELLKRWGWENVLHKLADGDITKYEAITELPVIFVFNQMSFLKDMKI